MDTPSPDPRPIPTGVVRGVVEGLPGSKSIAQRALVLAALADGESRIVGAPRNDDVETLIRALRGLGIAIERDDAGDLRVAGCAGELPGGPREVDAGENGTALRVLIALAALRSDPTRIAGPAHRPVGPLVAALRSLGAKIEGEAAPLVVRGPIRGGEVTVESSMSSQFATALLLVSPAMAGELVLSAPDLVSERYIVVTAATLSAFGAHAHPQLDGRKQRRRRPQVWRSLPTRLRGQQGYRIDPDASAAAFYLAAAAVTGGDVTIHGLGRSMTSFQADIVLPIFLEHMGCATELGDEMIRVCGQELRGRGFGLSDVPDLVPPLAAVAPFARGRTVITGIAHLRHKESDRIAVLARGLEALGFPVRAGEDFLEIRGGAPGHGAVVDPAGDHRMAMAFAVIGTRLPGVLVRDPGCVAKSDPGFFERLEGLLDEPGPR